MQDNLFQFLTDLGLSEKEITVYLCSLEHGSQTASTIALKTDLARSTVNFIFGELIHKGFASKQNKENTTYYTAITPELIAFTIEQKKAAAKKLETDFKHVLPLLTSIQNTSSPLPKVMYFEGLEGLYRTIDECCKEDKSVYFISSHNNMHPKVREYIEQIYIPASKKHTHKNKMILNKGLQSANYIKKAESVYDEIIMVDPQENPFALTTAIVGNKTLLISYAPEDLSGIIIENNLIANHMRTIFKVLIASFKQKQL
ncbi:hypothetical protein COV82_03600 [Candidatus Peregrinibacteria bacterium CG11_big_fil_rev_8_21_14_0_20_46_8]|nr:MAG: hypothetical protein COV82_03600 [Candidatus Peregrinibacteria bacterium CG11_big_fil_rev_8_21_14_0_20_46_8]